jgi:signal transduction histidine kinase/CheY-like chemotaxis protein
MTVVQDGAAVNLANLRSQLAGRLAVLLMCGSGLIIWQALRLDPFPSIVVALLAAVFGLGLIVRMLAGIHPILARHLLVWGPTAGLLAAMWCFAAPWLPFLGLLLIGFGAMLTPAATLAIAGTVAGAAAWLTHDGTRAYPLLTLFAVLTSGAAAAWLTARTLYTALEWAWTMQQRADQLLDKVRDRQAELNRMVKSLDLAYALQKRTQRELILARQQAEQARLMKGQYAANISHELRTPLNLILGFSEVMYFSPEVYGEMRWPSTLRRDVYQIYRSSRHLSEMIDDILDLSRFEMVGFALNKEPTLLESLLSEAVEIAGSLFQSPAIQLETAIAQDLPVLEVDRTRIRQVLLNLLNNAARFAGKGTVRVQAGRVGDEVIVSVSDMGLGIPAGELPHLFKEFYQVDRSLHREHRGTGLGLAICKRFVEAHEGRIWVESREGVGSTFSFALPIPGQYVPASPAYAKRATDPPRLETRPCILVVDPEPTVAALVHRHIEGYEVLQVADADQLAKQVALHHPRAVIRNVPPGERNHCNDTPLVPVPFIECSLPSQAWITDDLAVAACLTKPIAIQRLLDYIDRLGDIHEVLIIDDDRGFCQLIERALQAAQWALKVRRAYDGEEGLSAIRAQRPDLVLLDLIMPGLDGFQVLEQMRQNPELSDLPIVLLTAVGYAEDALARRASQIIVHRPDQLELTEVMRCLEAVISALEPRYDERSMPQVPLSRIGI